MAEEEEKNDGVVKPDESFEEPAQLAGPPVIVMPHELGGIKLVARGADGSTAISRLELPDAAVLLVHLNALITMMFQTMYMQQAMAAQEVAERKDRLFVPKR